MCTQYNRNPFSINKLHFFLYFLLPTSAHKLSSIGRNISIIPFLSSPFADYPFKAVLTQSRRGFPRVVHDGYTYGLPNNKRGLKVRNRWMCTGSNSSRKRCRATVETCLVADDDRRVRLGRQHHICEF